MRSTSDQTRNENQNDKQTTSRAKCEARAPEPTNETRNDKKPPNKASAKHERSNQQTKIKTINKRQVEQSAKHERPQPSPITQNEQPLFQYHHLQSPPLHPIQHHHHQSPTPTFGAKRLSPLPRGFRGCRRNRRPDADLYKPLPLQNHRSTSTPRLYITKKASQISPGGL